MDVIVNYLKGIIEELPHLLDTTKPTIFYQNGDFRISSTIVTTWIMMLLLFIFVIIITSKLERISKTRRQAIAEKMTMFFYGFVYDVLGEKAKKVYAVLGSIFITILLMNFMWVIPTFTTPTASFSTAFALGIVGFLYTQYVIIKEKNVFKYLKSYVEPNIFMLVGNLINIVARPLSISMRLFGNMFAGKILDSIVMLALPLLVPVIFSVLSILVGGIQSYVFALLLTMYISEGLE